MTVKITKPALNLREELADLRKPSGIAGEAMLRADSVQEQRDLIGAGRRNLIINGDCRISQRGDYSSATALSDETYYLDRFEQNIGSGTCTGQHISANQPPELSNTMSWKLTAGTTATSFFGTRQLIEDYKLFNGRPFTVSAYIKTNNPSVRFYLYNGASVVTSKSSVPNDGQWHRLEETFTFDAEVGSIFSVSILAISEGGSSVPVTSGDYIEYTGWQLELGSVATEFDNSLSYGEQLALCQRYYLNAPSPALVLNTGGVYTNFVFPTTMREAPAITVTPSSGVATIGSPSSSIHGFHATGSSTSGAAVIADAEL